MCISYMGKTEHMNMLWSFILFILFYFKINDWNSIKYLILDVLIQKNKCTYLKKHKLLYKNVYHFIQ